MIAEFEGLVFTFSRALADFLYCKDSRRSPPRGPANRRRDYSRDRDRDRSRPRYRSRDRDDYRRRPSRSPPPRRGRPVYRDRDREGYRSPEYDSRSRSRSRSRNRSYRPSRPSYGPESREVMMDGLPVEMVEEDVGQLLPSLRFCCRRSRAALHLLTPFLMARS